MNQVFVASTLLGQFLSAGLGWIVGAGVVVVLVPALLVWRGMSTGRVVKFGRWFEWRR